MDSLLQNNVQLKKVYAQAEKYHLQIFYTHVSNQNSTVLDSDIFMTTNTFIYCASLIKFPIVVLALCKLNELGINENTYLFIDSSESCHRSARRDTSSENGLPSIAQYIKKILLVSDNDAYNRCFEFLGTDYIHQKLLLWNYPDVRIVNRYDLICPPGQSKTTNPFEFVNKDGTSIFRQKALPIQEKWTLPIKSVKIGKAYMDASNHYISKPKDFSRMNYMSMRDAHRFMKDFFYEREDKFGLSENQLQFLRYYMEISPEKSIHPSYSKKKFPANYKKYLYFGDNAESVNDTTFVSANVVGMSYGFLADCARFKNTTNGIEFILSAAIYVNKNEVMNDGHYEYTQIGIPFLTELGKEIYRYEVTNKKKQK